MMVDWQIKDTPGLVEPLIEANVQPASIDLTLGPNAATLHPRESVVVVGEDTPQYEGWSGWLDWTLPPGYFALFETAETLHLPPDIAGKFEGKSSLGRIGLMTHITAGFIDPGFHGVLTLELYNCGLLTLVLRPGIKIGQVSFTQLRAIPEHTYGDPVLGSHYQDADTVQGARFD